MNFVKMQGAGNDFIVVKTSDTNRDWSRLAIAVCNRHFGIGADSLLLILPSDRADLKMRTFDSDGSEAEACGNGIRCVARYAFDNRLIATKSGRLSVETMAGVRTISLHKEGSKLLEIKANMGKPEFRAESIPAVIKKGKSNVTEVKSMLSYSVNIDGTGLLLNLVSMGNPHAVYFWQHPVSDFPLSQLGPKVEHLEIFPNRTNFEVARVLDTEHIEARVWERGVGETMACGSGACAITVAARLLGYAGHNVDIKVPGGVLSVEWNGDGGVLLSGPAEKVFDGEWPDEV